MDTKLLNMSFVLTFKDCNMDTWIESYKREWQYALRKNELPVSFRLLDATLASIYILADSYFFWGKEIRIAIQALLIHNCFLEGDIDWDTLPDFISKRLHEYSEWRELEPDMDPKNHEPYRVSIEQAMHIARQYTLE